jgi:hypothetical protein
MLIYLSNARTVVSKSFGAQLSKSGGTKLQRAMSIPLPFAVDHAVEEKGIERLVTGRHPRRDWSANAQCYPEMALKHCFREAERQRQP